MKQENVSYNQEKKRTYSRNIFRNLKIYKIRSSQFRWASKSSTLIAARGD